MKYNNIDLEEIAIQQTPKINTVTKRTIANVAYNFWYNWNFPDKDLIGNSGKHFSWYYFQGVVAKMFRDFSPQCIDVYSLRPDLVIDYFWVPLFIEIKSGYLWNWIIFRPEQLRKFLNSKLYKNAYCSFIFHKCRKLETKFKKVKLSIDDESNYQSEMKKLVKQLETSTMYFFPVWFLVDKWNEWYFDIKKLEYDTLGNPFVRLKEKDFSELYEIYNWEKTMTNNIFSAWISISLLNFL